MIKQLTDKSDFNFDPINRLIGKPLVLDYKEIIKPYGEEIRNTEGEYRYMPHFPRTVYKPFITHQFDIDYETNQLKSIESLYFDGELILESTSVNIPKVFSSNKPPKVGMFKRHKFFKELKKHDNWMFHIFGIIPVNIDLFYNCYSDVEILFRLWLDGIKFKLNVYTIDQVNKFNRVTIGFELTPTTSDSLNYQTKFFCSVTAKKNTIHQSKYVKSIWVE